MTSLNLTPIKNMIQTYQVFPLVAVVCAASALADCPTTTMDPVDMVKQNISLICSAEEALDDVDDAEDVPAAITKLQALTTKASALDKALSQVKPTEDQTARIASLNGDANEAISDMIENCQRIMKDNLMSPELRKAINSFAAAANIKAVETITTVTEEVIESN